MTVSLSEQAAEFADGPRRGIDALGDTEHCRRELGTEGPAAPVTVVGLDHSVIRCGRRG